MKIGHKWDQAEFDALLTDRAHRYKNSVEDYKTKGAITKVVADYPAKLINSVIPLAKQGYIQHPSMAPDFIAPSIYAAYLIKPEKLQASDLAVIEAEVQEQYRLDLQRRYDAHANAIATETVARKVREQEREQEAAHQQMIDEAAAEAIALLGARPE